MTSVAPGAARGGTEPRPRVLLVDDEAAVLDGLRRRLRGEFDVTCAQGGLAALEVVADEAPFAVVVSDMRMPDLDGVELLRRLRQRVPDTVRIMLTGYADVDSAIAAVNEGCTFRFLCKPCAHRDLVRALHDAVAQHRLVTGERQLLEETLRGSVQALVEVLSLAAPVAFERALLIRQRVAAALDTLGTPDRWEVEVASLLSQLGMVSLPEHTAEKLRAGRALDDDERQMVERMPAVTDRLLADIPRLDGVRRIIADHLARPLPDTAGRRARLLRIAADAVELEQNGESAEVVRVTLRGRYPGDAPVVDAVVPGEPAAAMTVHDVPVGQLVEGMTLVADIRSDDGRLVVGRGQVVTPGLIERLANFRHHRAVTEHVAVRSPS